MLVAGHYPQIHIGTRRLVEIHRQSRNTAQRHAPCNRNPRTHAPAHGRARAFVGRIVGYVHKDFRLHKPHASARSSGKVVDKLLRKAAAAPPANHLRNQRPLDGQGQQNVPRRPPQARMSLHYRGKLAEDGAHGVSGGRGKLQRKRRRRAPHGASQRLGSARLLRSLARKIQQQDKRRHAAPLA